MRIIGGSASSDAKPRRTESSQSRVALTIAPDPPRLLRAVQEHPSALAKLEPAAVTLTIRGQSRRGVARLQLVGHLGGEAEPLLAAWLNQAELASGGVVLLDLRHVSSMDEAGFLMCLRAWGHAQLRGLRLKLVNCHGDAERLLDITGTAWMFGTSSNGGGRPPALERSGAGWSPILIPQVSRDQ